jgi:hypothetical protein
MPGSPAWPGVMPGPKGDVIPGRRHDAVGQTLQAASGAHRPRSRVSAGAVIRAGSGAGPAGRGRRGRRAGGPGRVRWSAWAAAAGSVRSPAPGRARGRPGGRTVPGRASGRRRDWESRPLRSITSMKRCPALHPWNDARRGAWNGSWNGAAGIPVPPVLSVGFPGSSVQLVRPLSDAVFMVMRRPLDHDGDQGGEVPTVVRDPGRFARCMPDWRVNAGNWRSLPDSPIPYPTWDTQADPLRRATTCSTVLSDHPKLRRRCAGSAHYARLRSWTVARRSHGTVRGTTRRITPAQQVPSVRRPVQSVQLVRVMHGAVVLIIRRSWVRAPHAPPAILC